MPADSYKAEDAPQLTTSRVLASTPVVDFTKPVNQDVVRGKLAIVTGGASGLGLAIATDLAKNGAQVAMLDFSPRNGQAAEEDLSARSLSAKFFECDVASWTSQLAAFKAAIEWSKSRTLDIVVTSAGLGGRSMIGEFEALKSLPPGADPPAPSTRVLEVNLIGTYYSTHLAMHYFSPADAAADATWRPQLVLIASLAGYTVAEHCLDYTGAKYGVRGMWRAVRDLTQPKNGALGGGAQVNLLAPTFIATPMINDFTHHLTAAGFKVGTAEDVVSNLLLAVPLRFRA